MKQIQKILNDNKIFISMYMNLETNIVEILSLKKFDHLIRVINTLKNNGIDLFVKKIVKKDEKYSLIFKLKVA